MYSPIPMKRSTRYGNNYWEAFSAKVNRIVRFFSDLEYDHWITVEGNPAIGQFCEQPKTINVIVDGKLVESTFDMWIQYKDGKEIFVEVKYSSEIDPSSRNFSPRSKRQIEAQRKWCQENNHNHLVQTDKDIRGNPIYLQNLKLILPYTRQRCIPIDTINHQIKKMLLQHQVLQIGDIEAQIQINSHKLRESLYWMIFKGQIKCNLDDNPLSSGTEVQLID